VGVFDGVVDEAALLGEKVGTANELGSKSEALLTGDVDVLGKSGRRGFEVALVCVVEHSLAFTVEDALEVEGPSVVSRQVPVLLSGRKKTDTLLGGRLAHKLHRFVHGLAGSVLRSAEAKCRWSHSTPLESNEVASLCDGDGCQHALLPFDNVLRLIALGILKDLASELQNNTTVALVA
jgi:hypothetical protein